MYQGQEPLSPGCCTPLSNAHILQELESQGYSSIREALFEYTVFGSQHLALGWLQFGSVAMAGAHNLSKDFFELIKDIGESKSKQVPSPSAVLHPEPAAPSCAM